MPVLWIHGKPVVTNRRVVTVPELRALLAIPADADLYQCRDPLPAHLLNPASPEKVELFYMPHFATRP